MIENYNHKQYIADNARKERFNIEGNRWWIRDDGTAAESGFPCRKTLNHCGYFKTQQIAERVAKEQRLTNFISNMAYTLDEGKWEADWTNRNQNKYIVMYNYPYKQWTISHGYDLQRPCPYMSGHTAKLVVEELNRIAPDGELR